MLLTADTYTSVRTDLPAYAAEATARLVLTAAATGSTTAWRDPLGRLTSSTRNDP
ncbi:hypothetical protein EV385_4180 [Krasilnikovia cinnamomea]|uniref:Uncharacterized protein n=2 Tax=Krasilnikovia cinnamomea TaxID=349313 RepID=A0A4Q7ZNR0_9ACTN|nr:hypothetical protein EV385_4180 [Krasilnikovia cinnamomea]